MRLVTTLQIVVKWEAQTWNQSDQGPARLSTTAIGPLSIFVKSVFPRLLDSHLQKQSPTYAQ